MGDSELGDRDVGSDFIRKLMQSQNQIYSYILALVPNWSDADDTADIAGGYGVDLVDFAAIASHYGETNCGTTVDCQCANIDQSGTVDFDDLVDLVGVWLRGI